MRWRLLLLLPLIVGSLSCPRCGGRMRLLAVVQDPGVVEKIRRHLQLWDRGPPPERRLELDPTTFA